MNNFFPVFFLFFGLCAAACQIGSPSLSTSSFLSPSDSFLQFTSHDCFILYVSSATEWWKTITGHQSIIIIIDGWCRNWNRFLYVRIMHMMCVVYKHIVSGQCYTHETVLWKMKKNKIWNKRDLFVILHLYIYIFNAFSLTLIFRIFIIESFYIVFLQSVSLVDLPFILIQFTHDYKS